jgi:AraC-like DNA-binding protein
VQLHVHEHAGAGAPPDPLVSEAVRGLMPWRTAGVTTSLSASLHISETQLRRRCRAAVGLAPKVLHRMLRFQGFLALVQQAIAQGRAPTDDGLALLALRTGYADQSHLTRECVRLTGVTPRVFLAETQQACACGHEHSASFAPVLSAETKTRPHTGTLTFLPCTRQPGAAATKRFRDLARLLVVFPLAAVLPGVPALLAA